MKPIVYHIPVCPFCQRLEILLDLKGKRDAVEFRVVDITQPRDQALLTKTRGSTSLPVLETEDGQFIKESLVILRYLESRFPEPAVTKSDPYQHAVEGMLAAMEGPFCNQGYKMVMNQSPALRQELYDGLLQQYAKLDAFLMEHNPEGTFLFETFGWAEAIFTPFFMRFWFLDYYEGFALPDDARYTRVRKWRDACLAHPAAQQVTQEEIVKLYYDYAKGAGNGALLPGRTRSSFAFEPHWKTRPWPPANKYEHLASDEELGLL
jgi:glutathione S-transferase